MHLYPNRWVLVNHNWEFRQVVIFWVIKHRKKFVIFADFNHNLSLYEMSDLLPFSTLENLLKFLQISHWYRKVLKGSVGKNILKSFGKNLKIFANIIPLPFVYPCWFVNVKSKPKGGKRCMFHKLKKFGWIISEPIQSTIPSGPRNLP